jgi:pyrroloquinoline quinone biosynthesis protein B
VATLLTLGLALAISVPPPGTAASPASTPEAIVLGVAQDGGVPHAGCHQPLCVAARSDPSRRRRVASLGLVDPAAGKRFLIDATPDFPEQMEMLGGLPDAILLTHAHIGHYLGLAQLGREVLDARGVPVYATASMARFLRGNRPWSRLVAFGNIDVREIPGEVALTPALSVIAIPVPHRDEDSDTVAYLVRGPGRRILWLPDIDKWEKWDRDLAEFLRDLELTAFVDGTFDEADEIPGRTIADIPHPLVPETMARVEAMSPPRRGRVVFVHLNHTNRLLRDPDAVAALERRGFAVAREGQRIPLASAAGERAEERRVEAGAERIEGPTSKRTPAAPE